jgi:hypothetical protein
VAINQIEVELRDARPVHFDRGLVSLDQEFPVDEGLLCNRFLLIQLCETDEIGAGLSQARLVLGQLRFGLPLADLELPRINLNLGKILA